MNTKVAFLCLAHNNFDYLAHLSQYCCSDHDGFFLHLDNQCDDISLNALQKNLHPNTVVLSPAERYRTRWGTFNIALATIALLKKALAENTYNHFVLISGADMPLLTKAEFKQQFQPDQSYFSIWHTLTKKEASAFHGEFFHRHYYYCTLTNPGEAYISGSRLKIYTMLILNKLIALFPVNARFNYERYAKGSQWWSISSEMAQYMVTELEKPQVIAQFAQMHAPDEKLFHTLALNSPFQDKLSLDQGQASLKQGVHYIDWGFQKDKVALQTVHVNQAEQAKRLGCAFARKIDLSEMTQLIRLIQSLYTDGTPHDKT